MNALELQNVTKTVSRSFCLKNVSFVVKPGDVFGIIGPNGSGKTTLLSVILKLKFLDSGTIKYFDSVRLDRKRLGVVPEFGGFFEDLTGYQNLKFAAKLKNVETSIIDDVLRSVYLDNVLETVKHYSLGMKQRLSLASAMLSDPDLLIMDEPTNGLDVDGILELRNYIKSLSIRGKAILIASHLLSEIQLLCNKVGVFDKGRFIGVFEMTNLLREYSTLEYAYLSIKNSRTGSV